jgi:hypothetical protein
LTYKEYLNRTPEEQKRADDLYAKRSKNQMLENAPVRPEGQTYWDFMNGAFEKFKESELSGIFKEVIGETE